MSFAKKLFIVWLVLFIFCTIWSFRPAHAENTSPCVTRSEFKAVKVSWTKHQVFNKFDVAGMVNQKTETAATIDYPACNDNGYVTVFYYRFSGEPYRVSAKSDLGTTWN